MNTTTAKTILSVSLTAALIMSSSAWAEERKAVLTVKEKNSAKQRVSAALTVGTDKADNTVTLYITGEGEDGLFEEAWFTKRSALKQDGILFPQKSEGAYYNDRDIRLGGFEIDYDYERGEIKYSFTDEREARNSIEKTFELKGLSCDALNLPLFMESFLISFDNGERDHFYLLSHEPKLYKVNVYDRGREMINAGGQNVEARKIQLIGDMGPLTEMVAKFLPKTFLWFTPQPPYRWLKYEGLEKGPDSVNIVIDVK